jgi:hypothetical protein
MSQQKNKGYFRLSLASSPRGHWHRDLNQLYEPITSGKIGGSLPLDLIFRAANDPAKIEFSEYLSEYEAKRLNP